MIKSLYEDTSCRGIHNTGLSELFTVHTGMRQGCILGDEVGDENNNQRAKSYSMGVPAEAGERGGGGGGRLTAGLRLPR